MFGPLRKFFASPARQALGWAGLGILGIAFAAAGVFLILGSNDSPTVSADDLPRATATPTAGTATSAASSTPSGGSSPSSSASPSVSPTATESPTVAPTPTRAASGGSGSLTGGSGGAAPTNPTPIPPTPTPEPTPEPVVQAGGPYCPAVTSNSPPNSIFGLLKLGGVDAPAGTTVTMLFDGVPGPTALTTAAGGYKVNWAAAGSECANRVGAAIAIAVDGTVYASGSSVGGGRPDLRFDIVTP